MKISVFQLGQLGANCYIVADENTKSCAVVDPGGEGKELANWLKEQGLTPKYLFLTHYHFDHVGGIDGLLQAFPALPVYLNPKDVGLPVHPGTQAPVWTHHYHEGDELVMDGLTFRIYNTPGHTPGSVCIAVDDVLLTGDTLFQGSCGRTDFPGGSWDQMMASLRRLAGLPGNPHVLSGHGPASTLDMERARNPYMKEALTR